MKRVIVKDVSRNVVICPQAELADSFFTRMRGLLGRSHLPEGQGMVITHCNSVHMFFMRFPIDVLFMDARGRVVGIEENLQPGCLSRIYWAAAMAVELRAGSLADLKVAMGDLITISIPEI